MKILFTNTGPWGTGSFSYTKSLMQELERKGHVCKLFFPDANQKTEESKTYETDSRYAIWRFPIADENASLESFPCFLPDIHPRSTTSATFRDLTKQQLALYFSQMRKSLKPVIEEFQPDIIECQHIWAMQKVVGDLGYPYFCSVHHSDLLGYDYDERMRPTLREGAQNAEHIFVLSHIDKERIEKIYDVPSKKISIFPCGYNPELFFPKAFDREEVLKKLSLSIPKEAPIATFVGILCENKGVEVLLAAHKKLAESHNLHLLLIGSGEMPGMEHPNVHAVGYQPHNTLPAFHSLARFFVLPSIDEGFGVSCLEAMACGVPTIVTQGNAMSEYAVGEKVPVRDVDALAKAMEKMLSLDDISYHTLKNQALEKVKGYTWPDLAQERVEVYQNWMVKSSRPEPAT